MERYLDKVGLDLYHDLLQAELGKLVSLAVTEEDVINILQYGTTDVTHYDGTENFPNPGEANVIYVDDTTGKKYKWENGEYVEYDPSSSYENVQSDWNEINPLANSYIRNKPTKLSDFDNDEEFITLEDVEVDTSDFNGFDYVEIGGLKWATKNVGAESITDDGLHFQWGDNEGASEVGTGENQKAFAEADYKFGTSSNITKYNDTDNKTVLDLIDDAANSVMGGSWRMPTKSELDALLEATNLEWTSDYKGSGVAGIILTDKTDNSKSLFFPASGIFNNGQAEYSGSIGFYWTSTRNTVPEAYCLGLDNQGVQEDNIDANRWIGMSVRGVINPAENKALGTTVTEEEKETWNNKADKSELFGYVTIQTFETYKEQMKDKERTISGSLNELNSRIIELRNLIDNMNS